MLKKAIISSLATLALAVGALAWAQDNRIDTIRSDAPSLAKYGDMGIGVKTISLVNP